MSRCHFGHALISVWSFQTTSRGASMSMASSVRTVAVRSTSAGYDIVASKVSTSCTGYSKPSHPGGWGAAAPDIVAALARQPARDCPLWDAYARPAAPEAPRIAECIFRRTSSEDGRSDAPSCLIRPNGEGLTNDSLRRSAVPDEHL